MIARRFITIMRARGAVLVAAAAALLVPRAAPGGTIRLLDEARAAADEPVTLGMVARLEGDDAASLGEIILAQSAKDLAGERTWAELSLDDVRRALTKHKVNLTRHALCGSVCLLRLSDARQEAGPAEARPARPESAAPLTASSATGSTIRDEVVRALLAVHRVEADRLRVTFDPRDDEFLSRGARGAARLSVAPSTAGGSSRGVLRVRLYDGERITDDRSIRADVEIFRRVVVMRNDVRRKDSIEAADVDEVEMWVAPGAEPTGSIDEVAGSVARGRLTAGEVLRRDQIEPPVIVKKGDLLTVYCISDGVEITTRARAVRPGRLGERIEVRAEGSKRGYLATVNGRGRAVVATDGTRPGEAGSDAGPGLQGGSDDAAIAPPDEGAHP